MHPWIKKFQIAIIEENISSIDKLIKDIPQFETVEDMKSASAMIVEAGKILYLKRNEVGNKLEQMRKTKKFVEGYGKSSSYYNKKE
jgi:prefoldin subunit 5